MPAGKRCEVKNRHRSQPVFTLFIFIFLILIAGCQNGSKTPDGQNSGMQSETGAVTKIVPTLAPIFVPQQSTDTPAVAPRITPLPTETPVTNKQRETNTKYITIYSDGINPDWEIVQNTEVLISETGRPNTYEGRLALQVTPLQDFGQIIFRVKPEAQKAYLRSQVLALIMWISGGPNYIDTDDLAVTVFGSNQYPYWVADDQSVSEGPDSPFSETRLYFLGLNNAIPPNTWVEVVNWLDNLIYDPDYRYVTGFYVKNDEGFEIPYYIDEISLLMIDNQIDTSLPGNSPPAPIWSR